MQSTTVSSMTHVAQKYLEFGLAALTEHERTMRTENLDLFCQLVRLESQA